MRDAPSTSHVDGFTPSRCQLYYISTVEGYIMSETACPKCLTSDLRDAEAKAIVKIWILLQREDLSPRQKVIAISGIITNAWA